MVAQLKAALDEEEKKADTDSKRVIQGNGSSAEWELQSQIRDLTRFVNRNEEAPLAEMLERNKSEIAKLAPHVQVTQIH